MFTADVDINQMTMSEVLHSAIKNEKVASEVYKTISKIFGDENVPDLEKIFLEMSSVEQGHHNRLAKALSCYEEDKPLPEEKAAWTTHEMLSLEALNLIKKDWLSHNTNANIMRLEDTVAMIKNKEKESEAFYLSAAEMTERKDLQALFRSLAEEEAKHHRLINRIVIHALTRHRAVEGRYDV
jgi:rubrerythrin